MKNKKLLLIVLLSAFYLKGLSQTSNNSKVLGTWGHGNEVSTKILKSMPFIHGWNFTFYWRDLEPQKGKFNWKLFDSQLKTVIDNNLDVGFMVWVGQFSPEWVWTQDGVPKVLFNDKMNPDIKYMPYYLNPAYKADYMNLLKAVAMHVQSYPLAFRKKILFWMSAEGSTGDVTPYKADPIDPQYNISDQQWQDFKNDAWSYMYNWGNSLNPKLHILINPANNGMYFNYLVAHYPKVWLKAGSLAHTYQFDDEAAYYRRFKKVVRPDNNDLDNRIRAESESVQSTGWFQASPQQNNFALIASCLHFGLDIINVRDGIKQLVGGTVYPFEFFNKYAGQRDPATASGAFCMLRDVLDVADTVRFPTSIYGKLMPGNASDKRGRKKNSINEEDEIKISRNKNIAPERKQNILKEYAAYGAKDGTTPEEDKVVYKNDDKLKIKLRKENLRSDLMDKYFNDFGVNLLPGNYSRFLEQYSPNTTSRGYWRVGPVDQVYGRYARGFAHEQGMTEMFFALNKDFYTNQATAHPVTVSVTYFDKGNGDWSFNYHNGKAPVMAYKVHCSNTNRWITKKVTVSANTSGKLPNATDFTLKYEGGDNTLFSLIEIERI